MFMTRTIVQTLVLVIVALAIGRPTTAAPPASGTPYEINVILSLTGGAAFLGKAQQQALGLIQQIANRNGGVKGRPILFSIADDQSSPQLAVQLANAIIAKHVPIFIGSDLTAPCSAIGPLVEAAGPVEYCTSPGINPAPGGYIFSASASTRADAIAIVRYFHQRGWNRIGLITSTDASGQAFEQSFDRALALPENAAVTAVVREHFATADLSIAGQAAHIKAVNPQAVIGWTTGTPFGTVLRGLHDVGYDGVIAGGNGNMIFAQLEQYASFLPKLLIFPGRRAVAEGTPPGPIHDAQTVYFNAFKSIGVRPDFANNIGWDPAMIVVDTLQHLGPDATAQQCRDYIQNLHSWVGINGVYDFRDGSQRGIGIDGVVIDRWDAAKEDFVPVSKPGGGLK
jgi:branched-chain amino acid transport system substrate-binding protein